ncbi:SCO2322 family protein [Streptomyces sp. NPDC049881]|uniref:SCO2322 family protein n=1 Tax=Streptomyces sp. NPDC049881 TaxID=3155778 RepID=UPI003422A3EB
MRGTGIRALGVALAAAATVLWPVAGAASADDTAYRYWSFWEAGDGGDWAYADEGPGTARPGAGGVIGFRFAVSTEAGGQATPRADADFAAVCGTEDPAGHVAVVVDFGTPQDAPAGEEPPEPLTACADLPEGATAAEALASVAEPLRYDAGALLCGIAGYPERGCGEAVSSEGEGASGGEARDGAGDGGDSGDGGEGTSTAVGVVAGIAAVAVLVAAALVHGRRRGD